MNVTIGTCGNCGGPVQVSELWSGSMPQTPRCAKCGAHEKNSYGPRVEMEPSPSAERGRNSDFGNWWRPMQSEEMVNL